MRDINNYMTSGIEFRRCVRLGVIERQAAGRNLSAGGDGGLQTLQLASGHREEDAYVDIKSSFGADGNTIIPSVR